MRKRKCNGREIIRGGMNRNEGRPGGRDGGRERKGGCRVN